MRAGDEGVRVPQIVPADIRLVIGEADGRVVSRVSIRGTGHGEGVGGNEVGHIGHPAYARRTAKGIPPGNKVFEVFPLESGGPDAIIASTGRKFTVDFGLDAKRAKVIRQKIPEQFAGLVDVDEDLGRDNRGIGGRNGYGQQIRLTIHHAYVAAVGHPEPIAC